MKSKGEIWLLITWCVIKILWLKLTSLYLLFEKFVLQTAVYTVCAIIGFWEKR
jgi:hypothetical protein